MPRKIIIYVFLLLTISQKVFASQNADLLTDSAQVSLLTVTPSDEEAYTLFGHTAIRIQDRSLNLDMVFNYGLFNYDSPNFIYRFVKGETDYQVGAIPYEYFIIEYRMRGVGLIEQSLNLTTSDKQNIWKALTNNIKPENKIYRYNFLFDNCSTRVHDIIENNITDKIIYKSTDKQQTYRDLIHECTFLNPWTQFGIDIIIGSGADHVITDYQKDFLPRYLSDAFTYAQLRGKNGSNRNLVSSADFILKPSTPIARILYEHHNQPSFTSSYKLPEFTQPMLAGIALLLICIIFQYISCKCNNSVGSLFNAFLFFISGLAGCIICFLWFVSEHPCVNDNWNLIWLNPLQLIVSFLFFVKPLQKYIYYYHFINFVVLLLFLLAWCLIPQQLEIAFIPFILSLLASSGINVLQYKKYLRARKSLNE